MITPEEAWERLLPHLAPLPGVPLPLAAAVGRVLAADVVATVDTPFADVSAMDGYAIAGALPAGATLPVGGTIAAGEPPGRVLRPGEALRIMTGAPLPLGADRVAPVEDTDGGETAVAVAAPPGAGAHVRRRGEVHRRGDVVLGAGEPVTAGGAALLASHGCLHPAVHRPPRVALLVTGDEVVPAEGTPGPGQLRDTHTAFVAAAGAGAGAEVHALGIVRDDRARLRDRVAAALDHDVLLLSGGVSRGAFDFVEEVLGELGFRSLFDAVAIQPGKPLVAAVPPAGGGPLVFGLPGNPASVIVTFWLFVLPALRRLQGHADGFWAAALAGELGTADRATPRRDRFLPARVEPTAGGLPRLLPVAPRGSHDLGAYARGTALVRVPAGSQPLPAGSRCTWLPLPR